MQNFPHNQPQHNSSPQQRQIILPANKLRTNKLRTLFPRVLIATVFAIGAFTTIASPHSIHANSDAKKTNAQKTNAKKQTPKKQPVKTIPIPLESRPYQVRIDVAFAANPSITPPFQKRIIRQLQEIINRSYGRMWQLELRTTRWLAQPGTVGLQQLTTKKLLTRFSSQKNSQQPPFDKLFVLTVEQQGPHYKIAGREWDVKSQTLNEIQSTHSTQPQQISQQLFSLLPRLFRPVLLIDKVNGRAVQLRLQAAAYPPIDPTLTQLRKNDIVIPTFRYLDKKKQVKDIRPVVWTYIAIDKIEHQFVTGSLISDRGGRLGTGRMRRVELVGLRQRPHLKMSQLKMVYQTDETKSLAGYHVHLVAKRFYRDKPPEPPERQFSGRNGLVTIAVHPQHPIIWVYVYSGSALLARVPYVPGLTSQQTLPLPDDSIRLDVEGRLTLLQGRIIDIVAQRTTLMALAKKIADNSTLSVKKREEQIEKKFDQINTLPSVKQFDKELSQIRYPAILAAQKMKNRFAERKIKRLCQRTETLIQKFLNKDPVRLFREKLKKQLAEDAESAELDE